MEATQQSKLRGYEPALLRVGYGIFLLGLLRSLKNGQHFIVGLEDLLCGNAEMTAWLPTAKQAD